MIVPIVLAAGKSERMGEPKALLDFNGLSAVEVLLRAYKRVAAEKPVVVVGHEAAAVRDRIPFAWLKTVENPDYEKGQTSSLQCGVKALHKDAAGFLLWPVDMPLVADGTVKALLTAWKGRAPGKSIAVPVHAGQRGHPAVFGSDLFAEILGLSPEEPLHAVLRKDPARVAEVSVDDPWCVFRMDTPEQYRQALAEYRQRPLHL